MYFHMHSRVATKNSEGYGFTQQRVLRICPNLLYLKSMNCASYDPTAVASDLDNWRVVVQRCCLCFVSAFVTQTRVFLSRQIILLRFFSSSGGLFVNRVYNIKI